MNMKRTKNTLITILLGCLIAAMTGFIFSQSSKSGEESASLSGKVTVWILAVWGKIISQTPPEVGSTAFEIVHILIRKLAHFTEFFVLGALWLSFISSITGRVEWRKMQCSLKAPDEDDGFIKREKIRRAVYFFLPPCVGLLTAIADECMQIFSLERGPSALDVGIDFLGVCAGIVVAHALIYLLFYRQKKAKTDQDKGTVYEPNAKKRGL